MKTFLEVESCECRWPVAKTPEGAHLFCAEATGGRRKSYCAAHAARVQPQGGGGPHEERYFVTRMAKRPAQFRNKSLPPIVRNLRKETTQDLAAVLGQRSPETHKIKVVGARGKHVDDDGFETAEREPDLVELFGLEQ